jgi:phosphatidylglycerophosphate synthase
MLQQFGPYAANALTAARVLLTPLFVWLACAATPAFGVLAVVVFATVAASDVFDGRLARRWGRATNGGRTFDHVADIGFILTALCTYVLLGVAPWWVPAVIGGSFAFYVVDSWSRPSARTTGLIGSRVGHVAGILNYGLVGVLVCNDSAGIHLLSQGFLDRLFWLVPLYSALAVIARLGARRQSVPVAPLIADS